MSCFRNEPGPSPGWRSSGGEWSRLDDEPVDLAKLGEVDQLARRPVGGLLNGLCIDPLGGFRIALDLEVLRKLLAPDRLPFAEESLDLFEDKRVALDRRRVMRLFVPDALPDRLGLDGKRQPTNAAQIVDRPVEPAQDVFAARPSATLRRHLTHTRLDSPNSVKLFLKWTCLTYCLR